MTVSRILLANNLVLYVVNILLVIVAIIWFAREQPPEWFVSAVVLAFLGRALFRWAARRPGPLTAHQVWINKPWDWESGPHEETAHLPERAALDSFTQQERQFLANFELFGTIMNRSEGALGITPWRLHEKSITKPERHYTVFYNRASIGELKISFLGGRYDDKNPSVDVEFSLQHVRFLPFQWVRHFLHSIAFHTWAATEQKNIEVRRLIEETLLALLWDTPPWGAAAEETRRAYGWEYADPRPLTIYLPGSLDDGAGARFYLEVRSHGIAAGWAR
jgi:hypothetical protein